MKRVICVWEGRLEAMTPEEMEEEAALALARLQEDERAQKHAEPSPVLPCSKAALLLWEFARERGLLGQGEGEAAKPRGPENRKKKPFPRWGYQQEG